MDLVSKHKLCHLAQRSDNEKILNFFNSAPMKGDGLILSYDRSPDFFRFLDAQSEDYFVFWFGENEIVEGVGTVVIRPGMIRGEKTFVGYLGDLRFNSSKKLAVAWRKFYSDLIKYSVEIEEFHFCRFFLTAIIDENKSAINSLVMSEKNSFKYSHKQNYQMINILGRKPFCLSSMNLDVSVDFGNSADLSEIKDFLKKHHDKRPFGFVYNENHDELDFRLKNWKNFSVDNLIILKKDQRIVAVTGLWSPSCSKKIIVKKIPNSQKIFLRILSIFFKSPKLDQELKVFYLNLLTLDSPEMIPYFLKFIFKNKLNSGYDFLALTDYDLQNLKPFLKGFFYFSTPMSLYQVFDKSRPEDEVEFTQIPGFEMSLV